MKKIAVCLKPQQINNVDGYSVWNQLPFSVMGVRTLNYAISIARDMDVELIAFIMAPMKYANKIEKLYYWGFSKIVYISDPKIAGADSLGTATIISRAILKYDCNAVITGKNSEDSCTGQVPIQIAAALNAVYCTDKAVELEENKEIDNIVIAVENNYPEIFPDINSVQNGSKKCLELITLRDLGLENINLKYTDVVRLKQVELISSNNQPLSMLPEKVAEIVLKIIEVNNNA